MDIALSLTNEHKYYSGLELALKNHTNEVRGAQVGAKNVAGEVRGAQVGLFNWAGRKIIGVQVGLKNDGNINGAQIGLINGAGRVDGVQFSGFSNSAFYVKGAQIAGIFNIAKNNPSQYEKAMRGVQASLFYNFTDENSRGLQIGLLNYRKGGNWYSRLIPLVAIRTGKKN